MAGSIVTIIIATDIAVTNGVALDVGQAASAYLLRTNAIPSAVVGVDVQALNAADVAATSTADNSLASGLGTTATAAETAVVSGGVASDATPPVVDN